MVGGSVKAVWCVRCNALFLLKLHGEPSGARSQGVDGVCDALLHRPPVEAAEEQGFPQRTQVVFPVEV